MLTKARDRGLMVHRLKLVGGTAAIFADRTGKLVETSGLTSAMC